MGTKYDMFGKEPLSAKTLVPSAEADCPADDAGNYGDDEASRAEGRSFSVISVQAEPPPIVAAAAREHSDRADDTSPVPMLDTSPSRPTQSEDDTKPTTPGISSDGEANLAWPSPSNASSFSPSQVVVDADLGPRLSMMEAGRKAIGTAPVTAPISDDRSADLDVQEDVQGKVAKSPFLPSGHKHSLEENEKGSCNARSPASKRMREMDDEEEEGDANWRTKMRKKWEKYEAAKDQAALTSSSSVRSG